MTPHDEMCTCGHLKSEHRHGYEQCGHSWPDSLSDPGGRDCECYRYTWTPAKSDEDKE